MSTMLIYLTEDELQTMSELAQRKVPYGAVELYYYKMEVQEFLTALITAREAKNEQAT